MNAASFLATLAAGLLLAACTSSTGGGATVLNNDSVRVRHGIAGTVVRSPTVPVVRPGQVDWAPLAGAQIAIDRAGGSRVGIAVSDSAGRFFVELAPGGYQLVPQPFGSAMFPTPPGPQDVVVPDAGLVQVRIDYDTGIR